MLVLALPIRRAFLGLVCTVLFQDVASAQAAPTRAQSVAAGAKVYGAKGCSTCHSVNGIGSKDGPDLGRSAAVTSANELTAAMWNHLPRMAGPMRAGAARPPRMKPWEAADLVAFLFWSAYGTPQGDARAGERLFNAKNCILCHQVGGVGGVVGPRLDGLGPRSPIDLAAAFWNHAPGMESEMRTRGLTPPRLEGRELNDLLAYLASGSGPIESGQVNVLPGQASAGQALFRSKGCLGCHRVGGEGGSIGPNLGALPRRDPVEFAAAMWNKGPGMMKAMREAGLKVPPLTGSEMADLMAYFGTLLYLAGEGNPGRGMERLRANSCLTCHSVNGEGARRAPDLGKRPDLTTRAAVLAGLWNHVTLKEKMLRGPWPTLGPDAVADLVAYFEMQGRAR